MWHFALSELNLSELSELKKFRYIVRRHMLPYQINSAEHEFSNKTVMFPLQIAEI